MGTITRTFTNNIGSNGVLGSSAFNNASLNNITSISGVTMKLLSTATASGDASLSFTSNIDSTYDEYWFVFNNIHPATDLVDFQFNASSDSGSNYNVTKTSSAYWAEEIETGGAEQIQYRTGQDLAQSTGYQPIINALGNGSDESGSGIMKLFNPSSTTFVKHFITQVQYYHGSNYSINLFIAGYLNTTSVINAIDFKMSSGNIDAGTIKLYGVS